jgi:Mycobacterium membrane protein
MADFRIRTRPRRDSISCGIGVDCAVKAERISHKVNVFTFCLWKAA